MLDLTFPAILRSIGFIARDLITEDWRGIQSGGEESWTQAIGRGYWVKKISDRHRALLQEKMLA